MLLLCSKLNVDLLKIDTKSQIVTKFNVTKSSVTIRQYIFKN
jgi:hypothetical protein